MPIEYCCRAERTHDALPLGDPAPDRFHWEVKAIGATIVSPPREYPEYTPAGYYALFFKDLEGIKHEIATHSECQ